MLRLPDSLPPSVMYEAFELCRLVEKLPLRICAIATWGELRHRARETPANDWCASIGMHPSLSLSADDVFILSTVHSKGDAHLLVYQIQESSGENLHLP